METNLDKFAQAGNEVIELAVAYEERQNDVTLLLNQIIELPIEKSLPIMLGILLEYPDQAITIQDAGTTFINKAIEDVVTILDERYVPEWSQKIPEGKEVSNVLMFAQLLPQGLKDGAFTPLAVALLLIGDNELSDLDVVSQRERSIAILAFERLVYA